MTQAKRRHDRLAVRLSLIVSRLVAGEALSMAWLVAELSVSVRILRQDFRERLMHLDLEYRRGQCRLRSTSGGVQDELDALTSAHRSGLADIFSGLDRRLAGTLLTVRGTPCLVWQSPQTIPPVTSLVFYRLASTITVCQRILLLAEGECCGGLVLYRLMSLDGSRYLIGEFNEYITVHPLVTICVTTVLNTAFTPRKCLSQLTTQVGFIRALPHFSCTREVLSPGSSEEEQGNTLI